MERFIMGITTNDVNYCPKCGGYVSTYFSDGSCQCDNEECKYKFYVCDHEEYEAKKENEEK